MTMRVSKSLVVETAARLADENGLNDLSLKTVAETLHVRTPSLYNHIESLDALRREVAHQGMRTMNEQMTRAAVGKAGAAALKGVAVAYLDFITAHPGVYETIQWATWHGTAETAEIYRSYTDLLTTILSSFSFPREHIEELVTLFAGLLHGFSTQQVRSAFSAPQKVRDELCNAVDIVVSGACRKYDIE